MAIREMYAVSLTPGGTPNISRVAVPADTKSGNFIKHPTFGVVVVLHPHTALVAAVQLVEFAYSQEICKAGNIFDVEGVPTTLE